MRKNKLFCRIKNSKIISESSEKFQNSKKNEISQFPENRNKTFKNFLIQKIQSLKEKKNLSIYLKVIILYNNNLKKWFFKTIKRKKFKKETKN